MDETLAERLEFARDLATRVGKEALNFQQAQGGGGLKAEVKGLQDFVTEADKKAERTIRSELFRRFPMDGFIGEETGGGAGPAGYWVVDPIDGTTNFMRGLRHWGVSIAFLSEGRISLAVVHDTPNDRLYYARAGEGAFCDGHPIRVSKTKDPHAALGILGVSRRTEFEPYLDLLRGLNEAGFEHRHMGSAAIGLVRTAHGMVDFYYEAHLNCWDALAGILIAEEAGAVVKFPTLDQFVREGGAVLCSTPALSHRIQTLLENQMEASGGGAD